MKKFLVILLIIMGAVTNVYATENSNKKIDILYSDLEDKSIEEVLKKELGENVSLEISKDEDYPKTVKVKDEDSEYDVTISYHGILVLNRNVELIKDDSKSTYEIAIENSKELEEEGYKKDDILIDVTNNLSLDNNKVTGKEIGEGKITLSTKDSKYKTEIKVNVKEKEEVKPKKRAEEKYASVRYKVHVQDYGWEQEYKKDGESSGTSGESKRLEAIEINLDTNYSGGIKYRTHIQDIGWEQEYKNAGQISGTFGQSKRLEAIQIELYGEIAEHYDIYYRVHIQNEGWMNWAKNGQSSGSQGKSYRLEAIEIVLVEKGESAPTRTNIQTQERFISKKVMYNSHVQNIGWQNYVYDGEMSGTSGKSLRIEAMSISLQSQEYSGDISYRALVQDHGWMDWKKNGEIIGTQGQSKRLEAVQIKLTGEIEKYYDIYYRVHVESIGWMNWVKNGEETGTEGKDYRIEAIEIAMVEKGEQPPKRDNTNTSRKFVGHEIKYKTHVESIGWQDYVYNGKISGTSGQALRMEAISISLNDTPYSGSINYRAHVEGYGWMPFVKDGEIAGTEGEAKRLEAIEIKLTGEIAEHYDVYYRTHVEKIGWMNWAKNGEKSGTEGLSRRIEAIEIVLVEKGNQPPKRDNFNTSLAFTDTIGWQVIDGKKYYFYNDGSKAKYITKIDGKRYEFTANGELQHENIKLVIDVSDHNKTIDWDSLWNSGEIDGAIIRVAAGAERVDSKFEENMNAITRLNIPYGMYIYSYAENYDEGKYYAEFFQKTAGKYIENATLGVYFDLESNGITSYLDTDNYNGIVKGFMDVIPTAKIYTYTNYSQTILNSDYLLDLTTWIANYAISDCPGDYRGWQYTSKGRVTGISTDVDLSIFYY